METKQKKCQETNTALVPGRVKQSGGGGAGRREQPDEIRRGGARKSRWQWMGGARRRAAVATRARQAPPDRARGVSWREGPGPHRWACGLFACPPPHLADPQCHPRRPPYATSLHANKRARGRATRPSGAPPLSKTRHTGPPPLSKTRPTGAPPLRQTRRSGLSIGGRARSGSRRRHREAEAICARVAGLFTSPIPFHGRRAGAGRQRRVWWRPTDKAWHRLGGWPTEHRRWRMRGAEPPVEATHEGGLAPSCVAANRRPVDRDRSWVPSRERARGASASRTHHTTFCTLSPPQHGCCDLWGRATHPDSPFQDLTDRTQNEAQAQAYFIELKVLS